MDTSPAASTGLLTEVVRARARAEAREVETMLRYRDAEMVRIDQLELPLRRQIERDAVVLDVAQAMGLSEGQVRSRLASAERVRQCAPATWLAFRDGRVDLARVREISAAVDRLEHDESHLRLDQRVVAYAESHTVAELKRWLRRFVERVEPDQALQRAERARDDRTVEVRHGEDGMSSLWAFLPSPVAAAIERRLHHEAKTFDDDRSLAQRKADLLAAWATCNEANEPAVQAQIAVKLPAEVLVGARSGFAEAADGSWSCPATWLLDENLVTNPIWHRLVVDPITDDVLAHQYVGRLAPHLLQQAIAFRDGVCQAPAAWSQQTGATTTTDNPGPKDQPRATTSGHCAAGTTRSRDTSSSAGSCPQARPEPPNPPTTSNRPTRRRRSRTSSRDSSSTPERQHRRGAATRRSSSSRSSETWTTVEELSSFTSAMGSMSSVPALSPG